MTTDPKAALEALSRAQSYIEERCCNQCGSECRDQSALTDIETIRQALQNMGQAAGSAPLAVPQLTKTPENVSNDKLTNARLSALKYFTEGVNVSGRQVFFDMDVYNTITVAALAQALPAQNNVLKLAHEQAELLGKTYGALQEELLTPLVKKTMEIMQTKGYLPSPAIDVNPIIDRIVRAAIGVVNADTYVHPVLSRQDAVKMGVAELHDAVNAYQAAQPACVANAEAAKDKP